MENQEPRSQHEEIWKCAEKNHQRGKIFGGLLIVVIGSLYLAKELGAEIPHWIFTWKMFLIAVGLTIGFKYRFSRPGWLILVVIGGVFLMGDLYPNMAIKHLLWPIFMILFGLAMMFKPHRKKKHIQWQQKFHHKYASHFQQNFYTKDMSNKEDYIDSISFMGGVKKNVLSKNLKGGDITNIFGGAEINLAQADFEKTATLDLTNVFGGTKLIIPSHWEISSELVCIFGSIEDKRPVQPNSASESPKILILKGTLFFGGIAIKSY